MMKRNMFLALLVFMAVAVASSASAATTWKRLGGNPFYTPSLTSEADLRTLVANRGPELKAGFTKAGYAGLYPVFMEQFPTTKITTVKVAPGATFEWMFFKKKTTGKLYVSRDVIWKGAESFDAFSFGIDKDGKRYEFVVPYACGNITVRTIGPIPAAVVAPAPAPAPVAAVPAAPAPAPMPVAPAPRVAAAPVVAPVPVAAAPVAAPPVPAAVAAPAPRVAAAPAPVAVAPVPVPVAVAPAPKVAAAPLAAGAAGAPGGVAGLLGGLLVDVGLSRQPDPANYAFARIGYELPVTDRLYLMGLLGGYLRWMGNDGGSAFTADLLLDYHWAERFEFAAGAGYWSGNDGQLDVIANAGYLVAGDPAGQNYTLFLEARLPVDEIDNPNEFGRFGLGLRLRF